MKVIKYKLVDLMEKGVLIGSSQKVHWGESTKLEFLKFSGKDLDNWLLRVSYFLKVDGMTPQYWVEVIRLHLEGKVIERHKGFIKSRRHQFVHHK